MLITFPFYGKFSPSVTKRNRCQFISLFCLLIECCSALAGVLPKYFNSEWSVARFHLHEGTQYTVAFGLEKNTVIILGMDGRYDVRK